MKIKNKSKKKELKQKRVINPIKVKHKILENKNSDFRNIKSKYILKIIFNNLKNSRSFQIIKYNKKLQNRLDFSFHDYREYIQVLSPIEIEFKLVDKEYGKFINIPEKIKIIIIYFSIIQKKKLNEIMLKN